jgi:hypothetical protein
MLNEKENSNLKTISRQEYKVLLQRSVVWNSRSEISASKKSWIS